MLEAATEILEERGVTGLSPRSIARRAGVSAMAPYHHFAGKKGHLLAAVAAEGFRKMTLALRRARLVNAPPAQQLAAMCRGYIHFARTHPKLFRLMFGSELAEKHTYDELRTAAAETYAALVNRVEEVLDRDRVEHKLAANDVAMAVWSLGHGMASLTLDGQISPSVKRIVDDKLIERVTSLCLGRLIATPRRACSDGDVAPGS